MKSNTISYLTLLLLLLSHTAINAQQGADEKVTTRVDLVSIGDDIPGLRIGKSTRAVTALAFRYRKTLKYSGSRIMEISQDSRNAAQANKKEISEEDAEHELMPLPPQQNPDVKVGQKTSIGKAIEKRREKNPSLVALAVIPPGARHVTILLAPSVNSTYRAFVINDDPVKLPKGRMRIHNFCAHPISLKFDSQKPFVLQPQKTHRVKPKANGTTNYLLSYPKKGKWKIQESNVIRITPSEQVQMIILRSGSSFFASSSGARGGHLQVAVLRRDQSRKEPTEATSAGE